MNDILGPPDEGGLTAETVDIGPDQIVDRIMLPTGVETDPETGRNHGTGHREVPVYINPEMEPLGQVTTALYGPPRVITMREADDQVLLHELLHVLLERLIPATEEDPHGHGIVSLVEVALWETGWRRGESTDRWNVRLPDGTMWFRLGVGEAVARKRQAEVPGCTLMRWTRTAETLTEVPIDRPDPKVEAAKERVARRAELRAEAAAEGRTLLPQAYRAHIKAQFDQGAVEAREIVRRNRRGY